MASISVNVLRWAGMQALVYFVLFQVQGLGPLVGYCGNEGHMKLCLSILFKSVLLSFCLDENI